MGKGLLEHVQSKAQHGVEIDKTTDLFRRYAYLEHSCVRALSAWFLKHPQWEIKIKLGYFLFNHAEHVYEFQGRLDELRGGHRNATLEPEFQRLGEELLHAPDAVSFVGGLHYLLSQLEGIYQSHLQVADASANAMELKILKRVLPEIQQERIELEGMCQSDSQSWVNYLANLLESAGGISGNDTRLKRQLDRPSSARCEWPAPIIFDERIHPFEFSTYESKVSLPLRERSIGEFEVYFNEFYAAALLATIIYDSWQLHAPRQYYYDIAHHFWDEVRHAEFGAIRLRELGVEPSKVNMVLYEQSRHMPLIHRLCYLTLGLEIFFMPRKSERYRYYEQQGDARSQLFSDVDWSEEINHVKYGKRWVAYLLEEDARTVEDIQAEIATYLEQFQQQMPNDRKAPW
jgi:hypothetical protein